jgi:REP element-mobilizing transposase RayT/DNA-binding response OmpR family regulator
MKKNYNGLGTFIHLSTKASRDRLYNEMATNIIIVTPSPNFGESIRRTLEETEKYHVFVVNSKATAIVRADEESCKLAFLDLDMGEAWVEEVGQSLRTIIPNIKLFVLAQDETPPALDSIRPWTLVRKPFQAPDLLKTLSGSVSNNAGSATTEETLSSEGADNLPWLSDVNKAAQHLTSLTLASSSQAALITRDNEVWAYAGQLSQVAAQEIAKTLSRNWDREKGGDLLRFVRLESTKAEHMLYATPLSEGMLLAMVFDAETPFSTIRAQASQLASALDENANSENQTDSIKELAEPEIETEAPLMSEIDDEDDGYNIPPISDILKDIPSPNPQFMTETPKTEAGSQVPFTESRRPVIDPGETRPSIFAHPFNSPIQVKDRLVDESKARPETPIRQPLPGELDETRPHSSSDLSHIVLEPSSAGVYHLTYACLLVPRFTTHYLTGDVADRLSEWLPIICVAFGWRLEYLAVRPEYLQWVANVPPATSPGYLMRVMRQQISEKIFIAFPKLKRENPSDDFWAPGYLIMGGTQPHPPQMVKDYLKQIRQRQGLDKTRK